MKRIIAPVLLVLCLSCGVLSAQTNHRVSTAQSRADRKMQRKQAKAMKKALKAQRKNQRKMEKYDRKHTHDPMRPR
jgi:nitrate reductase cytochrome c-type subunit